MTMDIIDTILSAFSLILVFLAVAIAYRKLDAIQRVGEIATFDALAKHHARTRKEFYEAARKVLYNPIERFYLESKLEASDVTKREDLKIAQKSISATQNWDRLWKDVADKDYQITRLYIEFLREQKLLRNSGELFAEVVKRDKRLMEFVDTNDESSDSRE